MQIKKKGIRGTDALRAYVSIADRPLTTLRLPFQGAPVLTHEIEKQPLNITQKVPNCNKKFDLYDLYAIMILWINGNNGFIRFTAVIRSFCGLNTLIRLSS